MLIPRKYGVGGLLKWTIPGDFAYNSRTLVKNGSFRAVLCAGHFLYWESGRLGALLFYGKERRSI